MTNDTQLYTIDELSAYLRIPKSTLYKYSMSKTIPCFKIGRQLRFKKESINKWIEKQEKMKKK